MSLTTKEIREAYPPQSCALDTKRSCIGQNCPRWVGLTDHNGNIVCVNSRTKNGTTRVLDDDFRRQCREEHEVNSCWRCPDTFGNCK